MRWISGSVRGVAVAAALALALAGCTVGPSQRPPVAVRGDNVFVAPPPASTTAAAPALPQPQPQNPRISFVECTEDALATLSVPLPAGRVLRADCAELPVPADPAQPGLATSLLGIVRIGPADATLDGPPLLALGDSATEPSARHAVTLAAQVSDAVLAQYTIIGLDRRGSGLDRIDCAQAADRAALVDADPATDDPAERARLLEDARAVVQECNLTLPAYLGGYRSSATASDVERLQAVLGVAQLSAIGVGDGAGALAVWAGTVPGTVARLVLDAPVNPTLDEPELTAGRAAATEAAFDAFALTCAAGCPLGPDPRSTVTSLVEGLRSQPLAAPDGRRLTAGAAVTALIRALGEPRSWPDLTGALAAAAAGDPTGMLTLLDPILGPFGRFDAQLATACNDRLARLSPDEIGELATRLRAEHPLFGGTLALALLACAPWPTGGGGATGGAGGSLPPVLVLGGGADPRAPIADSRRLAEALAGSSFITWQGAGTGAYPRTPCITRLVDDMLVGGVVPTSDALCPP